MKNKTKAIVCAGLALALIVGFVGGMEYKAYQVRSAIQQAIGQINTSPVVSNQSQGPLINNAQSFKDYPIGQDIKLETLNLKVIGSKEQSYLQSTFGAPTGADAGAKFVIVTLSVTNLTNLDFSLPSEAFSLLDSKGRVFSPYQNTIGSIDNYLAFAKLSPSIPKQGVYVFELPDDAISYSFITAKAGGTDLYRVKLK